MSHLPAVSGTSQQSPNSPQNDPAEHLPSSSHSHKEPPPYQLHSPATSTSLSHVNVSGASSPHFTSASLMSPATSPNASLTPPTQSSLDPQSLDHPRRTSSKHRLSQDEPDHEPNKRQRTDHDRNSNDPESQPPLSFTPLYRLSKTPLTVSRPHPALNLLSIYNLDALSASVARKDPATGEKINKLRKSYEGKIKDLPGKNKAIPKDGELFGLLNYPEEEWDIHQVQGKDISSALSEDQSNLSDAFLAKLGPALSMSSAPLPAKEAEQWRNIIDLDNTASKAEKPQSQPKNRNEGEGSPSHAPSPSSELLRPRRRGTKRNYHDESFEGYEESFDDLGDAMSIDEDDRKSTSSSNARKKKRRRDTGSSSHFSNSLQQFSPTTVSVSR